MYRVNISRAHDTVQRRQQGASLVPACLSPARSHVAHACCRGAPQGPAANRCQAARCAPAHWRRPGADRTAGAAPPAGAKPPGAAPPKALSPAAADAPAAPAAEEKSDEFVLPADFKPVRGARRVSAAMAGRDARPLRVAADEQNPPHLDGVGDMSRLIHLDQENVVHNLTCRYSKGEIYTYVSSILIAVNPYELLGLYSEQRARRAHAGYGGAHGCGAPTPNLAAHRLG